MQLISEGRIRYFRKLKGWSQETLALQADMNPAFLGHLERGLKSPTVKTLEKIAAALDISMAELFSEPQPISDEKEALLTELRDLLQDSPPKVCVKSPLFCRTFCLSNDDSAHVRI